MMLFKTLSLVLLFNNVTLPVDIEIWMTMLIIQLRNSDLVMMFKKVVATCFTIFL
jgi:hypothetical protein